MFLFSLLTVLLQNKRKYIFYQGVQRGHSYHTEQTTFLALSDENVKLCKLCFFEKYKKELLQHLCRIYIIYQSNLIKMLF